ncbi:MAG: ImmA/IrrE family metallo-endopeptidase [Cyclobacteriaceae bacterium]|nr:ImmA/IrrE family metallo-endopeptidase [Cyclobacteriaceae bacterium]
MTRISVNINSKILRWAREERGFTTEEICQKIRLNIETYNDWEKNGKDIPFSKLQKLANQYKRQIAIFFLPDIPPKTKKPKDYRNLADTTLTKDTLFVIRKVNHFRTLSLELEGSTYWTKKYEWTKEAQTTKEKEQWLRNKLDISIDDQLRYESSSQAYRHWRNSIESKLGILVFQFAMPLNQVQGFCYSDYQPYCIVVNSKHSYQARIFTLFHELGHLVKHQSGICLPDKVESNEEVEFGCNEFAGRFLIPENALVPSTEFEEIKTFASQLKVSSEVYLRRLLDEGLLNKVRFFSLLKEIKASYKDFKQRKGGFVKPVVKSKAERGETFYNMIFENLSSNKIKYTEASEALGLTIKTIMSEV